MTGPLPHGVPSGQGFVNASIFAGAFLSRARKLAVSRIMTLLVTK